MERWKDVVFAIPPAGEQQQITCHLDQTTEQVAGAVDNTQREIAFLREYRTRLIADVVTGKLDVREAAARLPDETEDTDSLDDFETEAVDEEAAADSPEEALEDTEA